MLGDVLDWVAGREPVATATGVAGGVAAVVGVLAAFDVWRPTAEQVAAIGALAAWLAGWAARRRVTPLPVVRPVPSPDAGGIPLALILLALGVFALVAVFAASCDALFEDTDEVGDLGAPAWVADNRPCEGDNACQGRQKKGCAEASAPCSDDDQTTVIVCLPQSTCDFAGGGGNGHSTAV